jgi:hypothetical protein
MTDVEADPAQPPPEGVAISTVCMRHVMTQFNLEGALIVWEFGGRRGGTGDDLTHLMRTRRAREGPLMALLDLDGHVPHFLHPLRGVATGVAGLIIGLGVAE